MKRVVLVAGLLAATATTASAGGFVGLGIGGSPGTSGDVSLDAQGRSGRLELGYSFGRLAVEGVGSKFDLVAPDGYVYSDTSIGIAGTFTLPLSDGFSAYGRLGLQHTSVDEDQSVKPSLSGGGLFGGGGVELKLPLAAVNLGLFVDYTIAHSSLTVDGSSGQPDYGFTTRNWMLGAKLGF